MIVTLTGENEVLRQQQLAKITDDFRASHGEMSVERLDCEEAGYERICEAAASISLFEPHKLVILRTPGKNKELVERFERFIDGVADTNTVVLVEPKLDKRLAYYKQLKKLTDFREFQPLDAHGLARFAVEYAKTNGGTLSLSDARLLVDRLGANQLTLRHELDKLMAYAPQITKTSIELLTDKNPQSSIFELLEAAFSGKAAEVARLYGEQRDLRVEPQQVLAMIVWQLHILAIIKTAGNRNAQEIGREAKLSPFTVNKSTSLAARISLGRLRGYIRELKVLDLQSKTSGIIIDEALQLYLLKLCRPTGRS